MKTKLLFASLCLLVFSQCNVSQNSLGYSSHNPSRGVQAGQFESGKCYGQSIVPDIREKNAESYIVYTGDETQEDVLVETVQIEVQPASSQWIKKKANNNCVSTDPNDCLVWCRVDIPAEYATLKLLRSDTTETTNYEIREITKDNVLSKGGFTQYFEVLCQSQVTTAVLQQIQNALSARGYETGDDLKQLDPKTKKALTQFQRDSQLPVGSLDMQTLATLNVYY